MKKITPVFGPQELFNGAANCDEYLVAVQHSVGQKTKVSFYPSLVEAFNYVVDFPPRGVVFHRAAMRKIEEVPEPKRWTIEDQKAGRLPEVGAEVMCMDDSRHNFVGESIHAEHWALCHGKTKKVFHIPATAVRPVETDTERQQRLKEEWCHSALKLINDELTDACDAAVIYDALLSGELPPVQAKDGA